MKQSLVEPVFLRTDEYVAVKILSAHTTELQGKVACEREILEKIQQQGSSSNHPGSSHVLGLRDHFNLTSNHGNHLGLVTDVLGSTLLSLRDQLGGGGFPTRLVKKIASQCLLALDFLHSECEVIHTGEFIPPITDFRRRLLSRSQAG